MDPHLLLYVFLPALLFESANAIDFHVFKKVVPKTVTLAFPMMMLGSFMMGCVVRLAYPDWSWDICLLLGTITSATDPVAVVATLRELGAKVSLATTIEGESLLNDGSAVVLFFVLKKIALDGGVVGSVGDIASDFFRMAVAGPIIGWLFGMVALVWASRVFNDALVEISISIVCAYVAFYVSEFWVHSSGVLTVVFVGLTFSSTFGRTSISPEVFHFLHEFWETLGYVANTIIFLITGIAIAYNVPSIEMTGSDIAISIVIYAAGLVIRMMLFIFTYPLFTKLTYGWTWQEALIAAWGGLRGAVGLALGLDIMLTTASDLECARDASGNPVGTPNLACDEVRGRILLHTSMMVVLTLMVNASTLKPLLSILKFVELSHDELTMLAHVAERLKTDARKEMKRIQEDPFLSNSNWEMVRKYADLNELFRPLLKGMTIHKKKHLHDDDEEDGNGGPSSPNSRWSMGGERRNRVSRLEVPEILSRDSISDLRTSIESLGSVDGESTLLSEVKYHYHMSLKAGIWHLQHQGTLGHSATDVLVNALNHKLDDKHAVDWIKWEELMRASGHHKGFQFPPWLKKLKAVPILGQAILYYLQQHLEKWHDIAFGFLTVHEHLEHEVEHWTHDSKLVTTLHEVLHDNAEGARKSLLDLQEVLPEVCLTVNTKQAARLMLNATREKVQALEAQGLLPEPQAKAMVGQVETQMRKLQLDRMPIDLSKASVLREVSWLQELNSQAFSILVDAAVEKGYGKGEYLVRQGDVPAGDSESVFLVARGIVEIVEEYENGERSIVARRGSGVVIGEQSLLTGSPRAASVVAGTSVIALSLSNSAMTKAMELYPELADRMWHHVGLNLAQKLLGDAEEEKLGERVSTAEELHAAAEHWVPSIQAVLKMEPGSTLPLERKVLLLHGSCIEYRENEPPPTSRQLEELQEAIRREAQETQTIEQQAMQPQRTMKREKTAKRRMSLHAAIFGADGAPGANRSSKDVLANRNSNPRNTNDTKVSPPTPDKAAAQPERSPSPSVQQAWRQASNGVLSMVAIPEIGKERRTLHQQSPWIVHIAPCMIEVPTGGSLAKHELQMLSACRVARQPLNRDDSSLDASTHGRNHHSHSQIELEGAPLPLITEPHELRTHLAHGLMKKLQKAHYSPGEVLIDANKASQLIFVLSGEVACDIDPATPAIEPPSTSWTSRGLQDPSTDGGIYSAGEPFTATTVTATKKTGSKYVMAPPAGAPLGEWLMLSMSVSQIPRIVAHTAVETLCLTEDIITGAMQQDEQVATNLWWARCQRETYCFLRKLEPFCWWQPSKLWRWISMGKHVKVSEGRGILGAIAPFVVLVQGRCHVSYDDQTKDGEGRRGSGLGSMKLLGSGAKISDLLSFTSGFGSKADRRLGESLSPLTTPKGTQTITRGKWVPAPDIVHRHEEIAYHFARDSLVFVPKENALNWLPPNYTFTTPSISKERPESPSPPFGILRGGSPVRTGSPVSVGESDSLNA